MPMDGDGLHCYRLGLKEGCCCWEVGLRQGVLRYVIGIHGCCYCVMECGDRGMLLWIVWLVMALRYCVIRIVT